MKKTIMMILILAAGTTMLLSAQNTISIDAAVQLLKFNSNVMGAAEEPWVSVSGKLEPLLRRDYYRLSDSSGEISVKISNSTWRGRKFTVGATVTIFGEMDIKDGEAVLIAQFIQEGEAAEIPLSQVSQLRQMPDDSWVRLRGRLSQGSGRDREHYIFTDSTGEVKVEIDRDQWRGAPLKDGEIVDIYGEIDKEKMGLALKIDVEYIEKVQ